MPDPGIVVPLATVGRDDVSTAGGKGARLGELARTGFRVPPGSVVTTRAYLEVLEAADPGGAVRHTARGLDAADHLALAETTARVRQLIATAPLPPGIDAAIRAGYAWLAAGTPGAEVPVAVRSSATGEDGAETSYAGLQDTWLCVTGADDVVAHVRRCWASLYSVEAVTYRLRRGAGEDDPAMAVVIQQMVDARTSGVMLTCSPLTGDPSLVYVEASWGLGSAVVGGEVTPDSWVVDKISGEVVAGTVSTKLRRHRADPAARTVVAENVPEALRATASLTPDELRAVVAVGRSVEGHFGVPQDIEWAVAEGGPDRAGLFLLQSRPRTVRRRGDGPRTAVS